MFTTTFVLHDIDNPSCKSDVHSDISIKGLNMTSDDLQRREVKLTQEEGMAGVKRNIGITLVIALPG